MTENVKESKKILSILNPQQVNSPHGHDRHSRQFAEERISSHQPERLAGGPFEQGCQLLLES